MAIRTLAPRRDAGHTAVEMVVVLCLVGLFAAAVSLLVTGMRTEAASAACTTEAAALERAAIRFLAVSDADAIPATGAAADRYEDTLVDAGFLRSASALLDLDATGNIIIHEESPC